MALTRLPQLDRPFLTDAGLETDECHRETLPSFHDITTH